MQKELEYAPLDLNNLRSALIRQEESILFALIERAQFKQNNAIYKPGEFNFGNQFNGSFLEFCLFETECTHAKVIRLDLLCRLLMIVAAKIHESWRTLVLSNGKVAPSCTSCVQVS